MKKKIKITVDSIKKNKHKLFETDEFSDWVIKPNSQHINLIDAYKLILDFNETI